MDFLGSLSPWCRRVWECWDKFLVATARDLAIYKGHVLGGLALGGSISKPFGDFNFPVKIMIFQNFRKSTKITDSGLSLPVISVKGKWLLVAKEEARRGGEEAGRWQERSLEARMCLGDQKHIRNAITVVHTGFQRDWRSVKLKIREIHENRQKGA